MAIGSSVYEVFEKNYPRYKLEILADKNLCRHTIVVSTEAVEEDGLKQLYYNQAIIDDQTLITAVMEAEQVVWDVIVQATTSLIEKLAARGDYPVIRMWADIRCGLDLVRKANEKIPGWVYPKWSRANPGFKAVKTGGVALIEQDANTAKFDTKLRNQLKMIPQSNTRQPTAEDWGREMADSVSGKKRIVIKRAPLPIDPNKVKKPNCPIHANVKMEFDLVRQIWVCASPGCNQFARPKRGENDVILGKGQVQLRLIFVKEKGTNQTVRRVILQSDDNVALDVTELIDPINLIEQFEVDEMVKTARKTGIDEISNTSQHSVVLKSGLYVMGVNNA